MAHTIKTLSLCTGVGMLDIGLHAACEWLGWPCRAVGYCERDAYAAACLLARMEDASLEPAPLFCGNLEDLDAKSLRGWANTIVAGFPCQPWSAAGKQGGTADERWLWPTLFRIGLEVRPDFWFLENVPGLVSGGGLEFVLSDLAKGGWDAEWLNLTAESVGASHRRERIFILAYRPSLQRRAQQRSEPDGVLRTLALPAQRGQRIVRQPPGGDGQPDGGDENSLDDARHGEARNGSAGKPLQPQQGSSGSGERLPSDGRGIVGEPTSRKRRQRKPRRGSDRRTAVGGTGEPVGDAPSQHDDERTGQRLGAADEARAESWAEGSSIGVGLAHAERPRPQGDRPGISLGRNVALSCGADWRIFAPGPSADWSQIHEHLWPAIEPGFRLLVDGSPVVLDESRTDQLRCGGNGCVPLAAAVAFIELVRRAGLA